VPGVEVVGIDISAYGIANAKEEVRPHLQIADAKKLPFPDKSFDFVFSINTLHNLYTFDMLEAVKEIERVSRRHKYIVVESFRNEEEQVNLMYWVLTGRCFLAPVEWDWFYKLAGYTGDHSFIYFE
jgi:protein-L-isoaspartate(D-aspartate) O-methyltransferase